jgi:hypothetical protein
MRTIFPIRIQLALQVRCETEGTRRPPGADCERRKLLQRLKDERKVHRSAKAAERCQFGAVQPELARAGGAAVHVQLARDGATGPILNMVIAQHLCFKYGSRKLGAVFIAIYLATVATAAKNDLCPTAHAYKQSD